MSKFEEFCFLIVQRQKANIERKRLLRQLNKHMDNSKAYRFHHHKRHHGSIGHLKAYRSHANTMRELAKCVYSPLRRELKARIIYDSNNNCEFMVYDKEVFTYQKIVEIANAYIFDEIVLRDKKEINNPYIKLI